MRKAFTLVELMVVTVVIAILLTLSVRILGVGQDATARNTTIARLQRIENALSGYFAAFGSYPPVANNYSHNVYASYNENDDSANGENGGLVWEDVRKVCVSQPVAARFPFSNDEGVREYIRLVSAEAAARANSGDSQYAEWQKYQKQLGGGFKPFSSPNDLKSSAEWKTKTTWQEVKIFQFGLMSYLLPRYMFMTRCVGGDGEDSISYEELGNCGQWMANNRISAHPNTGLSFGGWENQLQDARLVRRIPSQAVCARWMPNFEGIVSGNPLTTDAMQFFGINTSDGSFDLSLGSAAHLAENVYLDQNRTVLDVLTVKDGWGREFYYYSPPPYQSYRLWSGGGGDGATFPSWIPLSTLKSDADRKTAANWMSDDIMFMNK